MIIGGRQSNTINNNNNNSSKSNIEHFSAQTFFIDIKQENWETGPDLLYQRREHCCSKIDFNSK